MSSVATSSPAAQIATNSAILNAMGAATNEAELTAARSATAAETGSAPAAAAVSEGFKADGSAWQNMGMGDFVATEAGRDNFMPFVIGGVVTYLLLGVMLPAALPADGKKTSNYMKLARGEH